MKNAKKLITTEMMTVFSKEFLNSENTVGTSDVLHKSGILHDVRESEPARSGIDKLSKTSGESPLENRTHSEKNCTICGESFQPERDRHNICDWCSENTC